MVALRVAAAPSARSPALSSGVGRGRPGASGDAAYPAGDDIGDDVGDDPEITTVARCGILRYSCEAAFRQADKER